MFIHNGRVFSWTAVRIDIIIQASKNMAGFESQFKMASPSIVRKLREDVWRMSQNKTFTIKEQNTSKKNEAEEFMIVLKQEWETKIAHLWQAFHCLSNYIIKFVQCHRHWQCTPSVPQGTGVHASGMDKYLMGVTSSSRGQENECTMQIPINKRATRIIWGICQKLHGL